MHALNDENRAASAQPETEAAASEGWDPGLVWRDRVQLPRLAQDLPHSGPEAPPIASSGWDPFQTWQYRVLRMSVPPQDGEG